MLCPICKSKNFKILYEINSRYIKKLLLNKSESKVNELIQIVKELWEGDLCNFVKCQNCSYIFAIPFIAGSEEFYSCFYSSNENYPVWKWDFDITLKEIINSSFNGKLINESLIDIGAGDGAFVKKISKFIDKKNINAIEYSEYGCKKISEFAITCLPTDFKALLKDEYKDKFSIICMFQLLEHISDLELLIKVINWISKNNSIMFITVPNYYARELYDSVKIHEDVPPIHVSRWNRKTFKLFFERNGWKFQKDFISDESYISKIKRFVISKYRFSIISNIKIPFIGKVIKYFYCLFVIPFNILLIFKLSNKKFGNSYWVCLRKIK
ncbi:MAG: methyltransferase domain-containing protein [Ignavibacteriales bacterium]|nr:methyltransferase domain-containing protein [Ignavibacteriales bacterium]